MKQALIFLTLGSFSGAGLAFLTQVFLARTLSQAEFGAFSAALSLVTLITPLAGFGVGMFWLKAFGEEGWQGLRWIKPSLKFALFSTGLAVLMVCSWAVFVPHDSLTTKLLFTLTLFMIGQAAIEMASAIYQLEERYLTLAIWQFLPHALRFILLISFGYLWLPDPLTATNAANIYAFTAFVMLFIGGHMLLNAYNGKIALKGHHSTKQKPEFDERPNSIKVLSESWPFGLAGVFYLVYFQSSIVLVKYMLGNEAAAQYSIVIVLLTAIYLFPSVIYQKLLLPRIHRWANHDRQQLLCIYKKGNFLMLVLGVLIAVGAYFLSPVLVPFIFGDKYKQVAQLMMLAAVAIPFRFVATSVGAMLVTKTHMRKKVFLMGYLAIFNVVANMVLLPEIGLYGAIVITIMTDVALLFLYAFYVRKLVFKEETLSVNK